MVGGKALECAPKMAQLVKEKPFYIKRGAQDEQKKNIYEGIQAEDYARTCNQINC